MSTVISVEHLSKRYQLGAISGGTLREDLSRWWARVRQKPDPTAIIGKEHHARHMGQEFWALQDVSFEVKEGEILGIIGRNGAGKSTLLKILSRVTGPTSGYVKIKGRLASLLEVGTGFHPELTGRENVFLNGAILGMTKAEIRTKFDEIVAFSEIEEFIDTPVKRYSSGMYVRLAFAVAAHLEPEILIVDEVLAVGDAQFQKKCLGKMRDVAGCGRTVLFVSHNMRAVDALCNQVLYLQSGNIKSQGPVSEQLHSYMNDLNANERLLGSSPVMAGKSIQIQFLNFNPNPCRCGEDLKFDLGFTCRSPVRINDIALLVYATDEIRVAVIDLRKLGRAYNLDLGSFKISGSIRSLSLVAGEYRAGLYVKTSEFEDNILDLSKLVVNEMIYGDGYTPYDASHRGYVELQYQIDDRPLPFNPSIR